jgi:CHAD domain-containing protein
MKRHRRVKDATAPDAGEHALHDVRKAAKRLRYAAESADPVLGKLANRLASRAEAIQELLGEHQDTVVARATLRDIAVRANGEGENGFTFGRLHGLEEARAAELRAAYPVVLHELSRKRLRRKLR